MRVVDRLRRPTVAGYCYPSDAEALRQDVKRLVTPTAPRARARLIIVPHSSYPFSGGIAGETLSRADIPRRCVILSPNHAGAGSSWSLMARGTYQTPLGEVPIDEALAGALLDACPLIQDDHHAHQVEHGIEVQLPFLQWLGPPDLTIVPLIIGSHRPEEAQQVGDALANVIRTSPEPVVLIASADLSHYEPQAAVAAKDARLLEAITAVDPSGFWDRLETLGSITCSDGVLGCALHAAQRLALTEGSLVRYATSAAAGGDPLSAIGYAGLLFN